MSHKTALKIYEYASYILIIGATVIYFTMKAEGLALTMLVLALAMTMRMLMERHRYKACEGDGASFAGICRPHYHRGVQRQDTH